ncbi:hypothetical protein ACQ4PT_004936 [Festuca glaucescens]
MHRRAPDARASACEVSLACVRSPLCLYRRTTSQMMTTQGPQAVASNYRGPTNFASPPRIFPSSPHHFSSCPLVVVSGSPAPGSMDVLPGELCLKIFHLLDHQSLAAAPQVCRKWNALTCDDELWRRLFEGRWGADAAAFYAPAPEGSKPWKEVFVVQDRCDRYGLYGRQDHQGRQRLLPHLPGRDPELPGHQLRLRRQGRSTAALRLRGREEEADI